MGSRYLTDLADVLRRAGLTVIELDGWPSRARGSGGYDAGRPSTVMVHHTASPPSSSGRPDAEYCALYDDDAPLSNLCLDRDGVWWVLAAGATNTNGAGGPLGSVPEDSMNSHAIGIEANGGAGETWPAVQTNAYVAGVATLRAAYGIADVFAHFEWAPDRKIDPAGPSPYATGDQSWDMDAFRADVERYDLEGDDMPLSDDDLDRIAERVWGYMIGDPKQGEDNPAGWRLKQIQGMCRTYLGGFQDSAELPDRTLLQQIHTNTK